LGNLAILLLKSTKHCHDLHIFILCLKFLDLHYFPNSTAYIDVLDILAELSVLYLRESQDILDVKIEHFARRLANGQTFCLILEVLFQSLLQFLWKVPADLLKFMLLSLEHLYLGID